MNKQSLKLLEKAFEAEISAAFDDGFGLIQTRSRLATRLEAEGYLVRERVELGGRFPVTISGYRLTDLGRLAYCTSVP